MRARVDYLVVVGWQSLDLAREQALFFLLQSEAVVRRSVEFQIAVLQEYIDPCLVENLLSSPYDHGFRKIFGVQGSEAGETVRNRTRSFLVMHARDRDTSSSVEQMC